MNVIRYFLSSLLLLFPILVNAQSVILKPDTGPQSTKVNVDGDGWPANAEIHAFFDTSEHEVAVVTSNANGKFLTHFCVPNIGIGIHPTFFTIKSKPGTYSGPIFTITEGVGNCKPDNNCPDAYLIGMHGTGETETSPVLNDTKNDFEAFVKDKQPNVSLDYKFVEFSTPLWGANPLFIMNSVNDGVKKLNEFVLKVRKSCPDQKFVLVGYSVGAWVVDEWLNNNADILKNILAVELYGDPLWYRNGPPYLAGPVDTYKGVARIMIGATHKSEFYIKSPQGSDRISDRWQSRCLVNDPICGEGYGEKLANNQLFAAATCNGCEHQKYHDAEHGLTRSGAKFLAIKAFPESSATPKILSYETAVEGDHVYIRLYYTGSPTGFGFVGTNGSGWAWSEIPFSSPPYWTRLSPGRLDYPFNHECSKNPDNSSDIDVWLYTSGAEDSPHVAIHLACSAPKEMITPFFAN